MTAEITPNDQITVYEAVRAEGHGHEQAVRCSLDVAAGSWEALDVGELRAQLRIMKDELERDDRRILFTFQEIPTNGVAIAPDERRNPS